MEMLFPQDAVKSGFQFWGGSRLLGVARQQEACELASGEVGEVTGCLNWTEVVALPTPAMKGSESLSHEAESLESHSLQLG